jgi:hypothetical protein
VAFARTRLWQPEVAQQPFKKHQMRKAAAALSSTVSIVRIGPPPNCATSLSQSVNGAKGCGANLFPEGQIIAFPAIKVTLNFTHTLLCSHFASRQDNDNER